MADNQGDEGRPESNSGDLDKSLEERIKRRAQADWQGAGPWGAAGAAALTGTVSFSRS